MRSASLDPETRECLAMHCGGVEPTLMPLTTIRPASYPRQFIGIGAVALALIAVFAARKRTDLERPFRRLLKTG